MRVEDGGREQRGEQGEERRRLKKRGEDNEEVKR